MPTTNHSLNDLVARKRRREQRSRARIRVISSGWKSNVLNAACLTGSLLLCLAHFEHLQSDADYKLLEFGTFSANALQILPHIVLNGHWLSTALFFLHLIGIKLSKTRFTFPSLLAVFAWPINAFLHFEQNNHHDYLISRLALSAFTVIISTAILFLPKKLKRTKKENTFYSAFSIASTPTSQQSSQLNLSQCSLSNRTIDFDNDTGSLFSSHTAGLIKRKKQQGTQNNDNGMNKHDHGNVFLATPSMFGGQRSGNFDTMSLRSGKTFASAGSTTSPSFSAFGQQSNKSSTSWREKRRESTPLREVRELIDDLLINTTDEDNDDSNDEGSSLGRIAPMHQNPRMLSAGATSPGRKRHQQGPFSSLTYNPAVHNKRANANSIPSSAVGSSNGASSFLYHPSKMPLANNNNHSPKTMLSYGGSACSSLSSSTLVSNASPFRRHL